MGASMIDTIICPNCGKEIPKNQRYCEYCGVDLVFAAVLAERNVQTQSEISRGIPVTPEALVPRIGDYLIEKGIITQEQLNLALQYQRDHTDAGDSILIGQVLLELEMIDRRTLDQIITSQIIALQNALSDANKFLFQRVEERTKALQNALKQLSELNTLKMNFIANISHELRTPLTHIKGFLELLANDGLGPLNDEQTEAVDTLLIAQKRLAALIEDLIHFSLASKGELILSLKTTNIGELLSSTVSRIKKKGTEKEINLRIKIMQTLPEIEVDQDNISWVFFQILDNAFKFTPEGGSVFVNAYQKDNNIKVSFTDTGIGIPEDRLDEIFFPFHQLDNSSTRKYSGTGLGLAMVKTILDAHHSKLDVRSIPGKGSHFEISFPVPNVLLTKE
jgi:signal transduction histidine kinase